MNNNDPTTLSCHEIFDIATYKTANIFNLNSGMIQEGKNADLLLLKLNNHRLTPNYHFIPNLIYSANSNCIDTTICNGKILMIDRQVEGETEIINRVNEIATKISNY